MAKKPTRSARSGAAERLRRTNAKGGAEETPLIAGCPQNATIGFLAKFCHERGLDEKVFVVPSFAVGRQIGQALAGAGEAWVNLRSVTLPALAHEIAAAELLRLGREQISETGLIVLTDTIFRELKERRELEYFGRLQARPGIARALLRAIQAVRLAGITGATLAAGDFCVLPKGRDIVRLLEHYERSLEGHHAFDLAGLYRAARACLERPGQEFDGRVPASYLCLEGLFLTRIEEDFLRAVAGDQLIVVPRDTVFGLERPRGYFGTNSGRVALSHNQLPAPSSNAERLSWLFDPAGAPPPARDGSVSYFRAIGQANECREVVRRILADGEPFDGVEIVSPPGPVYPATFHLMAARCGIPVTFAGGLPLLFTSPGRLFSGLADWVEARYPVSILCHLIESGDLVLSLNVGESDVPGERIGRFLRNAMIGWGRDRYLDRLNAHGKSLEAKSRKVAHGEENGGAVETPDELLKTAAEVGRLAEVLKDLFGLIPTAEYGEAVDFGGLASGFAEILTRFARIRPDLEDREGEALRLITIELKRFAEEHRALSGAGKRAALPLRLEEALERLRAAVASLTVGASSPLAGHVHVSSFGSGGFSGRSLTFVVGLNDTAVPGEGPQDPILLDAERTAISESLPTTADALKTNLYSLATLLASLRGRVVLSYASYDIMDERRLYPSSVLLQALRLVRGDPGLDYSDLDAAFRDEAAAEGRPDPAGFIPDSPAKALDERDWWLERLVHDGSFHDGQEAVDACFPVLRDGLAGAAAREGPSLTAYEGIVKIDRELFDPVRNHGLIMSASRLELLAKCPYGYFLRYVLRVEPPRDLELDRSRWLDPLERGSLIHEILFKYMTEATKRGERISPVAQASLMDDIAARVILAWRDEVPPPSEGIFGKERRDILDALAIFLRVEDDRSGRVRPFAFEKEFKAVAVDIGRSQSFRLRGVIDRIDRTGPGTYRIVDYKTGSYRDYEDFEAFGRGRRIQPALYALAAEDILGKEKADPEPRVTESGYFFPTRRGEGREIMVGTFDRKKFRELLADLLAIIAKGYFVTTTKDECGFCDFASVCGGAFRGTKEKLGSNPEIAEAIGRLKLYA
jgi:ATP-dependent helicase/nuclease subunit B